MKKQEMIEEQVGIGQQHNSFKIITEGETFENVLHSVKEMENKYFDLVWYARSRPENSHIKGVLENKQRIQESYPSEIKSLTEGRNPDWDHGFNSGMLAGMRYILDLVEGGKESADEYFPSLDS